MLYKEPAINSIKKGLPHAKEAGEYNKAAIYPAPIQIPQTEHNITLAQIAPNALFILTRLQEAGYQAYLVGGSVRDLLVGITPKDYDIATDAKPEEVKALFSNCRLIGKRFRLAHVFFGRDIYEVATFRANHPEGETPDARLSETGILLRDNIYGSFIEDAWRRDFTINALYLDSKDLSVWDHCDGMGDIKKRLIRVLGDPVLRFQEDPVRMLRAIRLAAKLNFTIEKSAEQEITSAADHIRNASPARLFDEVTKLFYCGHSNNAFEMLKMHRLFDKLFPLAEDCLTNYDVNGYFLSVIQKACENTDRRIQAKMSLNPAFLFAVLLWGALRKKIAESIKAGHKPYQATQLAMQKVMRAQQIHISIPKRFTTIIQEIWNMQHALERCPNKKVKSLFLRPRFRAAYDFLMLRMEAGDKNLKRAAEWWTKYQLSPEAANALSRRHEIKIDEDEEE
jgi:poly(A) polymerase